MTTGIKKGTIITSSDLYRADILIEDEKIKTIGLGLAPPFKASITHPSKDWSRSVGLIRCCSGENSASMTGNISVHPAKVNSSGENLSGRPMVVEGRTIPGGFRLHKGGLNAD